MSGGFGKVIGNSDEVQRLLDEMDPDSKKSLKSWYWFDWANQALSLIHI